MDGEFVVKENIDRDEEEHKGKDRTQENDNR